MAVRITFRECLKYAWHGSGRRWDAGWIGIIGGLVGGLIIWRLALKVPQTILDNPAWGAVAAIVIGAVVGVIVVFFARLCWAPLHFALENCGGLKAFFQTKSHRRMWPAILMILGLFLFVVLFGTGAIWFVAQGGFPPTIPSSRILVADPEPIYVRENDGSPFSWLETPSLNTTISQDGTIGVSSVNAFGKNESGQEVILVNTYLVSGATGKEASLSIGARSDGWLKPNETNPIPPLANLELSTLDNPEFKKSSEQFLREWAPYTVVIQVDGKKYRKTYSKEEIRAVFDAARARNERMRGDFGPRVTKRKP